jgi:hypothetical protein
MHANDFDDGNTRKKEWFRAIWPALLGRGSVVLF